MRRIVFVAAPGTEIIDLVGPLQVFARAAEMFSKQNPGAPPNLFRRSRHHFFPPVICCELWVAHHRT